MQIWGQRLLLHNARPFILHSIPDVSQREIKSRCEGPGIVVAAARAPLIFRRGMFVFNRSSQSGQGTGGSVRRLDSICTCSLSTFHKHKNRYKTRTDAVDTEEAKRKRWVQNHTPNSGVTTVTRIMNQIVNSYTLIRSIVICIGNVTFKPTWAGHDGGSFVFRVVSLLRERGQMLNRLRENRNQDQRVYLVSIDEGLSTKTCLCQFVLNADGDFRGLYGRYVSGHHVSCVLNIHASVSSTCTNPSGRMVSVIETPSLSLCGKSSEIKKSAIVIALCLFCLVYRGYRLLCLERPGH